MIATLCFWIARRGMARSLADVLESDSRAPVLYLRPFEQERFPFARISWGRRTRDFCTLQTHKFLDYHPPNPTFEEYFSEELRLMIGPRCSREPERFRATGRCCANLLE